MATAQHAAAFADYELEEELPEEATPAEPYAATCPQLRLELRRALRDAAIWVGALVLLLLFHAWLGG